MLMANQLVGFGVGGGLTSVSFLGSGSSETDATVPSDTQTGDIIVVAGIFNFIPAGYEDVIRLTNAFGPGGDAYVGYKISDGTDANDVLNGVPIIAVFRGNIAISSVVAKSTATQVTTGNPSAQVITSGSGVAPLVVIGFYFANSPVSPRTMSPAKDGEEDDGSNQGMWLAWKIYNSGSADVTVDMDDEGDPTFPNALGSFYLELGG